MSASLLSQWFVTYFVVGRTPSSGFSNTLKAKADEGVGRGLCAEQPGGPPHFAQIFNKLLGQETSNEYHFVSCWRVERAEAHGLAHSRREAAAALSIVLGEAGVRRESSLGDGLRGRIAQGGTGAASGRGATAGRADVMARRVLSDGARLA